MRARSPITNLGWSRSARRFDGKGCAGGSRRRGSGSGSIPTSRQKGGDRRLYTDAPLDSVVVAGRDGENRRRVFGNGWCAGTGGRGGTGKQEIDSGVAAKVRFGASNRRPGRRSRPYRDGRSQLGRVSGGGGGVARRGDERVTDVDNLSTHRAQDVLLWAVADARWGFVFEGSYAGRCSAAKSVAPARPRVETLD